MLSRVRPLALRSDAPPTIVDAYNQLLAALGREPTEADAETILQAVVGLIPVEPWMDLDNDGIVDNGDAIILLNVVSFIDRPLSIPRPVKVAVGGLAGLWVLSRVLPRGP